MWETLFSWNFIPVAGSTAALLIRWVFAIAMIPYGISKILGRKNADKFPKVLFFSPKFGFYSVLLIETLVPICLFTGFLTRLAVIPAICSFAVACKVGYEEQFHTSAAVPFFLGMIAILIIGSGVYSLDFLLMQSCLPR